MNFSGLRVLFLGAHPDDIELGCGAFIHRIAPLTDLLCATLSDNQKNPALKDVVDEHRQAMAVLGVPADKVTLGPFTTRHFPKERQAILEYLLQLRRDFNPDIVFVHSSHDVHQDHNTMTDEALRAYRGLSVLGFDVVRSSHGFFPNFLAEVSEADVEAKVAALSKYRTYGDKYYFHPTLTRAIMLRHGALAERPFAEGFDTLRIVGSYLASA